MWMPGYWAPKGIVQPKMVMIYCPHIVPIQCDVFLSSNTKGEFEEFSWPL